MKLAFFSDIHANMPALTALLADLDRQQPDAVYCLGDLVGYNIWPNEVIAEIRKRHIPTIAGNYDEGVGLSSEDCGCAYKTEEEKAMGGVSISYTNEKISAENRAYLRMLPRHLRLTFGQAEEQLQVLLVHGSPRKINEYLFEDRPEASLLRMMEEAGADIMLFGHTHKPYHRVLPYEAAGQTRYRHAINLGSVGKPKDGDPRACYTLLELTPKTSVASSLSLKVTFRRVEYHVEQAARAIEQSPLPDAYADMLRNGS